MMKIMQIILISFLLTSGCLQGGDEFRWSSKNCDRDAVSGVILTFDDINNLESWYESRELFLEYEINVTFYIDKPYLLTEREGWLEMLQVLASDGHEIGSHTMNHTNFIEYIESGGSADSYLSDEVISSVEELQNLGFVVETFAYPYGARNSEIDALLEPYFKTIRATRSSATSTNSWKVYCEDQQMFVGSAIENMEKDVAIDALDDARDGDLTVLLYSHELSNSSKWSVKEFKYIVDQAKKRNLPFLLMSDLAE